MSGHRIFIAALLLAVTAAAQAHSPYVLPTHFDASHRDHITVEASFAEELFVPDIVMKATDWHVLTPAGAKQALAPVYARDLALLEVETKQDGTYRISTGLREGRVQKAALINDEWKFFEVDDKPPAGARLVDMKSMTQAEVYVSRGAPTDAVLALRGKGLEIQSLTHPNKLFVGKLLRFRLLYDGKPLANQPVVLGVGEARYAGEQADRSLRSDASGLVDVSIARAGAYHLMTRVSKSRAVGLVFSTLTAISLQALAASHDLATFAGEYDLDRNGSASMEEFRKERERCFAVTDADRDGAVSMADKA